MSKTVEEYRQIGLRTWEELAPKWAARRESIERSVDDIRAWLVRELGASPGDVVLELAAGVGETGFEVAEQTSGVRLVSTDAVPGMVDAARTRARERGIDDVEFDVTGAEDLPFDDDAFDRVVCRFGYMLMADPARALAETRRVLRPGGRLVLAVWGPPDRNPVFANIGMVMTRLGHVPPPDPEAPSIFALADQDRLRGLLADAGFSRVRIEGVGARFHFESVVEYLDLLRDTGGGLAPVLRALAPADLARVRAELEKAFAPYRAEDGGFHLDGLAWCVVAS
jgi:ubiquinone/menaquinone biosynthesis C-methylase UbiE